MVSIGIVAEYNPMHNGHIYQIKKIKDMFPESTIVLVLSGNFTQRGETSIIDKWKKTEIALDNDIDLVIELPFYFATQSADIFARGSMQLINYLNVDYLVFGSEAGDINLLKNIANIQMSNKYNNKVKEYLKEGINYPTALSRALNDFEYKNIDKPNDILGISYIRELNKLNSKVIPITIKRTNDYNCKDLNSNIVSASSIRENISKVDISKYVPDNTYKHLNNLHFIDDYFPFLKYKIISEIDNLNKYQTVDEGIENKIKKVINKSNSYSELVMNIKSKRYTHNKIKRMLLHILLNFTKEDAKKNKDIRYIRILGFNKKGQKYLNKIKKETKVPIYTKFNKNLENELKVTNIYSLINNDDLIKKEIRNLIIKS